MSRYVPIIALLVTLGSVSLPAQAQEVPQMEARHTTATSHLFHVTLLVASRGAKANGGESRLPESVRAALDDVRGFLPYDSYEVLDTAMIRSDGHSRVKLRGLEGSHYTAQMTFEEAKDSDELMVDRFALVRLDAPVEGGSRWVQASHRALPSPLSRPPFASDPDRRSSSVRRASRAAIPLWWSC